VLQLKKGDIVYVLEQHDSGWWGGHKEGDETTGWFPGSIAVPKPAGDSCDYDGDDENSRAYELHPALATSDHRAVASPQKSRHHDQLQVKRLTEELASEKKLAKDLESSIASEREKKDKLAEEVRRLEAESSRLRAERDAERNERELRERERREKEAILERRELETQTRADREAATVALLTEELKRRDEQWQQAQAMLRQLEVHREAEASSLRIDPERVVESSLLSDGAHGTPRGSGVREDAMSRMRIASSSVTRQLFTQPLPDDAPPNSARGISRHGSEPIAGAPPAGLTQLHGNSARMAATIPPRPSPRGISQQPQSTHTTPVQPWRSVSNGPVSAQLCSGAASPRCGVKAAVSSSHPGADLRGPVPQVRSIISEIERRSTSQTPAPISRMADPSPAPAPHRGQTLQAAGATVRAASATVGATSRSACAPVTTAGCMHHMVTRAEPSRGRHIDMDGSEYPHGSPKGSEDSSQQVIFGMSPMGRPRGDKKPLRAVGHISTPSPTPKGPSINDRIRALYAHQK
jgi:hypothetical protein